MESRPDDLLPLLTCAVLPDQLDERRTGPQRPRDIRESGDRIGKEHRAEPADAETESLGRKRMRLGIAALEPDVVESLLGAQLTGPVQHGLRNVQAERLAAMRRPRGRPGRLSRAAADVDDPV